jgi:hypothetical protein
MTETLTPTEWNAYHLSHEAGVQSPDNRESPGALWLLAVRDAVVDWYGEAEHDHPDVGDGEDWWHDHTHHLADGAIPDATYARWQIFTDLCLWADEATLDIPALTLLDDHGYPVDMTAQATAVLYEVSHRLTWIILTELSNNDAEEAA